MDYGMQIYSCFIGGKCKNLYMDCGGAYMI